MYKINPFKLFLLFITLFVTACAQNSPKPEAKTSLLNDKPDNAGILLIFSETNMGESEKTVRLIVTDEYLRMDEGQDDEGFLLFDRQSKIIFNVVAEEKSILLINPENVELNPPFEMSWTLKSQNSHAVMRGRQADSAGASHHQFLLNGEKCYDAVTINGVLENAVPAIIEFRLALANELKRNYHHDVQRQCYEAINIFDPAISLQQGFPIREWSVDGYQRFLVDFRPKIIFPARLFVLPENYKQYSL